MPVWPLSGRREGLSGESGGRTARPTDNPDVMIRKRFMALNKCLHITNSAEYVRNKELPGYDKLGQV
jgi:hypothetical protein